MRPTPPLHPRIKVGGGHAQPVRVDPAEIICCVLLKDREGMWEGGMFGFVDVEDNVGRVGRV
jgi:hypothetical protein